MLQQRQHQRLLDAYLFFFFMEHLFSIHSFIHLCSTACRILVPQPQMESMTPTVKVWHPNHWTDREVPGTFIYQ